MSKVGGSKKPLLASVAVLVVICAAFGYSYVGSSSSLSSLSSQVRSLDQQATSQSSLVGSLEASAGAQSSSIASLGGLAATQSSSLASQESVMSLLSSSSALLKARVDNLTGLLANLNGSKTIVSDVLVEPSSATILGTNFTSFSAPYAGFVIVQGVAEHGACGGSACGVAVVYDPTTVNFPTGTQYDAVAIHSYNSTSFVLYSSILPSTDVVVGWQSLVYYSGAVSQDNANITVIYYY